MKPTQDYSFEQFQRRREEIRNRSTKSPKKLFSLFVTTFSIVLFSFLFIATIISPNLNIPALNNDDNLDTMSSDFKGQSRIDSRLNEIKSNDTSPRKLQGDERSKLQTVFDSAQNSLVELSTFGTQQNQEDSVSGYSSQKQTRTKLSQTNTQLPAQSKPKQAPAAMNYQQQKPTPYVPKTQKQSNYSALEEGHSKNSSDSFKNSSEIYDLGE